MPKASLPQAPKPMTRKQLSRSERESKLQRLIILGTAAIVGLALLILAWGLLNQLVLAPRRPVATVAGETITRAEYDRRLRYRRWDYNNYLSQLQEQRVAMAQSEEGQAFLLEYIDQQIQSVQVEIASLDSTVLEEMIDEKLYRQEATRRGLTVTGEDVQLALEEAFGYDRNPPTPAPEPTETVTDTAALTPTAEVSATASAEATATVTSTDTVTATATPAATPTPFPTPEPMTEEDFQLSLSSWAVAAEQGSGFTETDLRALIEAALYRDKVNEALQAEVPTAGEQVHARHILVATQEEADAVVERLNAGEDFTALAAELSTDESNKQDGGDLGWFPRGVMDPAFEEAAFALEPGQTSDPVQSSFGFHIIRVEEAEAERPYEPEMLTRLQQAATQEWLENQRLTVEITRAELF